MAPIRQNHEIILPGGINGVHNEGYELVRKGSQARLSAYRGKLHAMSVSSTVDPPKNYVSRAIQVEAMKVMHKN